MRYFACLLLVACGKEQGDTPPPPGASCAVIEAWQHATTPARFQTTLDAFESKRQELNAPGVAFAILEGDTITFAAGLGTRDERTGEPLAATSLMRTGSTLKMQTAAALLVQIEEGRARLDDPLTRHLPDLDLAASPGHTATVTLHHLLSHQGAFADYTPIAGGAESAAAFAEGDFEDNVYAMAPAGEFWNYSNPNFALAGLVAETVSGLPYEALMTSTLWQPLCMQRTMLDGARVLADGDYAVGRTVDWVTGSGTAWSEPDSFAHNFTVPAGLGFSNVLDMLRFAHFVMHGNDTVLGAGLRTAITSRQVNTFMYLDRLHYGYGVSVADGFPAGEWYDLDLWQHSGAIYGFSADLYMLPSRNFAVAILSNTDGAYFGDAVAVAFNELVDLPPATQAPDGTVDPNSLDAYAATYFDAMNVGTLNLARSGGEISVDAPTLDAYAVPYARTMAPLSPRNFLWQVQGYPIAITFVDHDAGDNRWLRTRYFVAERQGLGPLSLRRPPTQEQVGALLRRLAQPSL